MYTVILTNIDLHMYRDLHKHNYPVLHYSLGVQLRIALKPVAIVYLCFHICYIFTGSADTVHIPGNRVHQHSDHLQHHSQGGHCTSGHAHTEILLLGCQPPGPKWSLAQRPG